jgi:hypothetical protein
MSTKKQSKKQSKKQLRPSPSEHASDFKNKTLVGNDGNNYTSQPDKNGVYRWKKAFNCKTYTKSKIPYEYVLLCYELKPNKAIEKSILEIAKDNNGLIGKRGLLKSGTYVLTEIEYKFKKHSDSINFKKDIKKAKLNDTIKTSIMGKDYEVYGDRTTARPNCEWQQSLN